MKHAKESLEAYRADFVRASGVKGATDVAGEATATYSMCAQVPPRAARRAPQPHVYRLQPLPRVQAATVCVQVATVCVQVPPRVHAELPRAAVVLVLRNEIDRAASHYARCRFKVSACFGFGSGLGLGLGLEGQRVRG